MANQVYITHFSLQEITSKNLFLNRSGLCAKRSWCRLRNSWRSLVVGSIQTFYDPSKTDIQQPYLVVQVINFFFQVVITVPSPIKADRSSHEIDGHNKTKRQHGMLWFSFIFLQDIHTGQSKKGDSNQPEESSKYHMQDVEEKSQEQRGKPVSQKNSHHQHKCPGGVTGHHCWAKVVGKVGCWKTI